MKIVKYIMSISIALLLFSCSEDKMDDININYNNTTEQTVKNILPDACLKSAYETTGTDIAWWTSVYIEHNAGTWAQSGDADQRIGQEDASLFNNNWNNLYDVMNICQDIIKITDPETGRESSNFGGRGVAQILMAYNLAVATDMWGEVPFSEAFQGADNLQPKYDKQSDLYPIIFQLLDDGIANLQEEDAELPENQDLIYAGDIDLWIKAAHSLKARYYLRLTNISATAAEDALAEINLGFTSSADNMLFDHYAGVTLTNPNPWANFWYERDHLSISSSFFKKMEDRNDPRRYWFTGDGITLEDCAPIGRAERTQGRYPQSQLSTGYDDYRWTAPTPMMTYHELLYIKAEAEFRTGAAAWQSTLEEAITANFAWFYDVYDATDEDPSVYFNSEVLPRLTAGNELEEIITQKYIGLFEAECIECYNDYRRTGFPEMENPNNETVGFPNRFPYPVSEASNNSQNVPKPLKLYVEKVWWAGGTEKL